MHQVIIRHATPEDLEQLEPLVRAFVTSFPLDSGKFASSFARLVDNRSACVLVAQSGAALCGYCLGFAHDTFYANGKVGWLEELMVSPDRRRSGIGHTLVGAFESWASAQGAVLSGLATRRAADFYRAIGYEESATYFRRML